MRGRFWRPVVLVLAAVAVSLPLNLLGPLRPIPGFAYTWDASVDASKVPTTMYADTSPSYSIKLTNTGTATWPANPPDGTKVDLSIYYSYQNRDTATDCIGGNNAPGICRYGLPYDVAPGNSVTIAVQKGAPFHVGTATLEIDLVKEYQFWFEAQTPNLPFSLAITNKVICSAYCTNVMNAGPTAYWRLNDHQNGAGPYRDARGFMDVTVNGSLNGNVTDRRPPADPDLEAASIHVAPAFQAEPNNNTLNVPIVSWIPNEPATIDALGGWVKQDPDQAGHGSCFIEGSPVNGNGWLCRDASGVLTYTLWTVCNTHGHAFIATGGTSLNDGNWHYVLGRFQDGANAESELWVDGTLVGSAPKPNTGECTGSEPLAPIREIYMGQNFHGFLSEVAYWQTPLAISSIGPLARAPIGGPVTAAQSAAGGVNACSCPAAGSHGNATPSPIDTSTGNFWHVFTDLLIPGRSYPLQYVRTYNSQSASSNSPLGYGWQFNAAMSLSQSGSTVTITQENSSQASFTQSGSTWTPSAPRFIATLTHNGDGSWTFVRGGRDTYTFNSSGQLTAETDLNGYSTTLTYAGGNLSTVTDQAGRTLSIGWTGSHITSVTDNNVSPARTVQFQYNDGAGNLTDVIDVNGGHSQFSYDSNHRMTVMKDPKCYATSGCPGIQNSYDSSGRVQWQKDQLNRQTTFTYGTSQTTVTDPKGNQRVDYYNQGLRTAVTSGYGTPQAATTQYFYDPTTLALAGVVDPNGNATLSTVDSNGNVLTTTDSLGRTTTNTYNALNELLTTQDPNGVTTTNTYNSRGDLTTVSRPLTGTSQVQTTTYNYADANHPGDVTSMIDPDSKTWTYTYDSYGNRASVTDPLGDKATSVFNADSWMTSSVSPKGNVRHCGCQSTYTTTDAHDTFGNVTTVTDPLGHQTTRHYDADQNLDWAQDGNGNKTTYVYDLANQQTQVQRPDTTTLTTDYNADGTVLDQKDGKNNAILTYGYDALARATSTTDALGNATSFTYDGAGNQLTKQDPGGNCSATPRTGCTSFTYDSAYELKAITYSDGVTPNVTNVTYDGDGQRTGMTDGTGTSTWVWDSLHRMTSYTNGSGAQVQYAYNLRNLPTTVTYPGSLNVTRSYDSASRLTSVQDWLSNTTSFGYDPNSNLTTETLPSGTGIVDTFTYDAADRLMAISDVKGSATVFAATYTRNSADQLTSDSSAPTSTGSYKYTSLNQVCYAGSSSSGACSSPPAGATGYTYDAADNLVQRSSTVQTFNAADELCWAGATNGSCASPPSGATTYTYDTRGNRTQITPPSAGATTLAYDQANRLTGYGANATYSYNGDGLRMTKTNSGTTSQFLWDVAGNLPLLVKDGLTAYVYGPASLPLEQINGNSAMWLHHDQLGSTRLITDSSGTSRATYSFDPYGNLTASTGTVSNPLRFSGQYQDAESGYYYLRARYYDAASGQFLTRDPAVESTRLPYAYVEGNPLNDADPAGLYDCGFAIWNCVHVGNFSHPLTSIAQNLSDPAATTIAVVAGMATAACFMGPCEIGGALAAIGGAVGSVATVTVEGSTVVLAAIGTGIAYATGEGQPVVAPTVSRAGQAAGTVIAALTGLIILGEALFGHDTEDSNIQRPSPQLSPLACPSPTQNSIRAP